MLPEALHAPATGLLILGMIGALITGRFGPDLVLLGTLTVMLLAGIVEPAAAVAGFANPAVITVAMLYVVAEAMKQTGAMYLVGSKLIGRPDSPGSAQARLVLPVAGLSAFVNNTPIVAMFLPVVHGVARRCRINASSLFMPLSFASILGGVCTLIGTSTNVVVAGLVDKADLTHDGQTLHFGMFTLAWVGVPIAVVGLGYMMVFGRKLLPERNDAPVSEAVAPKEYFAAMRVAVGSPVAGKTVEQAGLRNLPGLFLSRIDRLDQTILAVAPDETIQERDVLVFVGELESVVDLQQMRGLEPVTDASGPDDGPGRDRPNLKLIEAVVARASGFVGRTIRDAGIRTRYGAVVVAVHRRGHRLQGKVGDIVLQAGDVLLMEAARGFTDRFGDSPDFHLVTERRDAPVPRHDRAWIALAVLAALVLAISFKIVPPMVAAMAAAATMVLLRCCTGPQARAGVDWTVLVVIGSSFGIGAAMQESHLAERVAHAVVGFVDAAGPHALLAVVYILTVTFTMTMTNNAAAVLMFPIATSIATEAHLNPMPFAVAITIAASCEFSSPIGYQTNLMVMGPGGYRWLDYTRFGGPLTILCGVMCIGLAPVVWPF